MKELVHNHENLLPQASEMSKCSRRYTKHVLKQKRGVEGRNSLSTDIRGTSVHRLGRNNLEAIMEGIENTKNKHTVRFLIRKK